MKNDIFCKENGSTVFLKEREQYFEIQDLKAQLQDKNIVISELKKLIEKIKGKSMDTKFDKPSVVRQPNPQRIPKPSILGKSTPFSDSLERKSFKTTKSVTKTNMSESLSKPVTTQILPQTASQVVRNTNMIKPGMYRIDTMTTQTRAPQLLQTSKDTNPRALFNSSYSLLTLDALIQGNITIKRVYYIEGLNYNFFLVGQFCDADLEVAFRKSTCFMRDPQGNDLLTAKALPTQAWLWHRRLSYLNFNTINMLSKKNIVNGLPKLKYVKDQLCSSCKLSKAK
ncbi:retrovirus-related pol polyprotein from transposon TNT 1-94 [Tanacetum coccineum]